MTVKELIEELKEFDSNKKVMIQYRDDGGDYWGGDDDVHPVLCTPRWLDEEVVLL